VIVRLYLKASLRRIEDVKIFKKKFPFVFFLSKQKVNMGQVTASRPRGPEVPAGFTGDHRRCSIDASPSLAALGPAGAGQLLVMYGVAEFLIFSLACICPDQKKTPTGATVSSLNSRRVTRDGIPLNAE
jgi:hypothetical protein